MREASERLVAATEERRIELGRKWREIRQEAGFSHQTLSRWRHGEAVDVLTDLAFERALRWAPGARDAIAAGKSPTPLDGEEASATGEDPRVEGAPDDPRVQLVVDILDGLPPAVEREIMRRRGRPIVVPPEDEFRGEVEGKRHSQ